MLANIIRKINDIFKEDDEEDDLNLYQEDREKEVIADYENGLKKLALSNQTYKHFDNFYYPILKEHERQNKNYKIRFEFIPKLQNFKNVRSALQYKYRSIEPWKNIRDKKELGNQGLCCICHKSSFDYRLSEDDRKPTTATECHEVWAYENRIQKLIRLESLCFSCHQIKHINRFYKNSSKTYELMMRYCELNNIEIEQAEKDLEFAYKENKRMSDIEFLLDMSLIGSISEYEFMGLFNPKEQAYITFLERDFKKNNDDD